MPLHVSSTCAHHQEFKIALNSLWYHHTYRCIFISVINQLDAQKFCFTISLFHASTCFEHMCSSSGVQNCISQPLVSSRYTASGIITLHSLWYHHITQPLVSSHYTSSGIITLHNLWYHHITQPLVSSHYTASGIITPIGVMIPEAV